MRSPTRRTPTPPNPDLFDQQRCTEPAPIPAPADEPLQTGRTALWRDHHLLAGRHITRRRRWIRPYDGHWGCLFHPLFGTLSVALRPGGFFCFRINRSLLCCSRAAVGLAHWRLAVHHPRRGLTTVHIVFNHCRQIRTPGLHLNSPLTPGWQPHQAAVPRQHCGQLHLQQRWPTLLAGGLGQP